MVTNRVDVNSLLTQMREMKSQAMPNGAVQPRSDVDAALSGRQVSGTSLQSGSIGMAGVGAANQVPNFSEMFGNAINAVNETQQTSAALASAYEQGDQGITLSQVMVASQKASVSFSALTQVRNKLVEAYQDVMNMPI